MSYYDLGRYSRKVSAATPTAQTWFDRGLNWTYGYNHAEAVNCFTAALSHDPDCAMALWGVAYASGPNYNLPWHLLDRASQATALATAFDAVRDARELLGQVTEAEAALIDALSTRYPQRTPADDMRPWNEAFADKMRQVYNRFPEDLDMRTVFVEAIMNLTPWKMWDLKSGAPADGAGTLEAMSVLEEAFDSFPAAWDHPGLLHLYIHLMEMSPFPERALKAAAKLRDLVPDAGHLIHMASHIEVLCGHYHDVLRTNQAAIVADRKFLARAGARNFYTGYRQHDYHFAVYGAMFLGQLQPALDAAAELVETTPESLLRVPSPPMADFMESYLAMKPHVLIRFGKWKEILAEPLPEDRALYCTCTATLLYARGVAHAALGDVNAAKAERSAFEAARAEIPASRRLHNNRVVDLMEIAAAMLDGEIAYRSGDYDTAFAQLRHSVALDDALPYDEPWGWMQPTRHALGALLLEQGRLDEAEEVYLQDLGLTDGMPRASIHPGNVWALAGLHECLVRKGQSVAARMVKQKLDLASGWADRPVSASCFCAIAAQ